MEIVETISVSAVQSLIARDNREMFAFDTFF
jgi:hypothetical protein